MNVFSRSIDIKQFQNLLDTSNDERERRILRKLMAEEKEPTTLAASGTKKE